MLPRIVVPANARLQDETEKSQPLSTAREGHLVQRCLIPLNAKLTLEQSPRHGSASEPLTQRKLLVGKLLVPAGAQIGESLTATHQSSGDDSAARGGRSVFDDALLIKPALGRKRTAAD